MHCVDPSVWSHSMSVHVCGSVPVYVTFILVPFQINELEGDLETESKARTDSQKNYKK